MIEKYKKGVEMRDPSRPLIGSKEIESYCGRCWEVVSLWIKEKKFPAKKIDGRWEAFPDRIDNWRKKRIEGDP